MKIDHNKIEIKWQKYWEENNIFQPNIKKPQKKYYNLMMFPYPSAEGLHIGNMYAFTGSDIHGRYMKLNGYDLFEPIGLDGFGIHSENYAIKKNTHPAKMAMITKKNFYRQLKSTGNAYAWKNTLETYDPDYYKWTQWLFIQMYKSGLAVRKKAPVNWCPSCKTVLADEQVISGKCERCDSNAIKKDLNQWFFKITDYADRLDKGIRVLDWSEKVKIAQKNWIGKSKGSLIEFDIENDKESKIDKMEVFTTRADTLYGATYMVIAPEHEMILNLKSKINNISEVEKYIKKAKNKTDLERTDLAKDKTGIKLRGLYAVNPVNKDKLPIFVADYVLINYGTGAIMAVPAHDERDYEFAKKYKLDIKRVISSKTNKLPYTGEGKLINSGEFNGFDAKKSISRIIKKVNGKITNTYRLRDWLISRQRYWGPPIPMIKCKKCGWVPENEINLPVKLPETNNWRPKGAGKSPLEKIKSFVNTKCPKCGNDAKRETDVSDTFLDSAWYFLRYPCVSEKTKPFDKNILKNWLPVDMYIGGAEHSVLHLLYVRFITMFLYDKGLIEFNDPFKKFRAHGMIIKNGAKMSKSRGNVVNPDDYIEKYGADALRTYLMFLGPFSQGGDFSDTGINGISKFIKRIIKFIDKKNNDVNDNLLNKTIVKVKKDIEKQNYNTAISTMMIFINNALSDKTIITNDIKKQFLIILSPFMPHICEELYSKLGYNSSIFEEKWPEAENIELDEKINIAIMINGKKRALISVKNTESKNKNKIINLAKKNKNVIKHIKNNKIKKEIFIPGKIVSFVI